MTSTVDLNERIPNNVDLAGDRRLKRALEAWQPGFLDWWHDMGPVDHHTKEVYLRTAVSVDRKGWANFAYTRMQEYRWGIFLAEPEPDRRIAFGQHQGEPVWQEVPGEYRAALRRLIVVQGDTEPASVEQQRQLGLTCPSLYDLRNLFQVNVEEGRHLWAMVYLLHAHFGRDGREEAEGMLQRRSGDPDRPRMLGAFNERTPNWLSYFMFTFLTDRDGKYQLSSMVESGFDPLARTCRFMLTEEAHHMFVGITGLSRVLQRTCELMQEHDSDDIRRFGAIDLPMFQRYMNFHFSVTIDLFGSELSGNSAANYSMGLKSRYRESHIGDDHRLEHDTYAVTFPTGTDITRRDEPALNALNERLRDDYVAEVEDGLARLNRTIAGYDVDFTVRLPHRGFNRKIGAYAGMHISPDGTVLGAEEWQRQAAQWLPSDSDRDYLQSIMEQPVLGRGQFANWMAPPARGINEQPIDFEYVRFD